ncbi:MAG: HD domain-containing protein [Clostridiales bacterium]|nr:HD domain-containing protein [Clostridiales bacterium]
MKNRIVCALLSTIITFSGLEILSASRVFAWENAEGAMQVLRDSSDDDQDTPSNPASGYSPFIYNNTNGLPTSEANAIAQTSEGFLWIGSYSGLVQYDGNTFERVDSAKTGITSVISLYVDSKNRLWAGTNDNGAAVLEKGEWTHFDKGNGLKSMSVRAIAEDENGLIYLATTKGVALVNEDMTISLVQADQIKEEYIRSIMLGPNNVIYALTMHGAVFTMKDGKMTAYYDPGFLRVEDIHAILPDPAIPGNIYCATSKSSIYYGPLNKGFQSEYANIEPLSYVNSLHKYDDELWVCADNGIGRVIHDGKDVVVLDHLPMTTSIETMTADYQKNLWFVSSQQGVMKIVPNRFSNLYDEYKLDDDVVYSTCRLGSKLFVGTKTSGLLVLEDGKLLPSIPLGKVTTAGGKNIEQNDLVAMLNVDAKARIRSIARDSKGRLWFCSFSKYPLICYDGQNAVVYTVSDGLPASERVRAVFECSDGSMAVACTGGVAVIRDGKVEDVIGASDGIDNTEILTVTEGKNGDLLLGTDGDGLYLYSGGKLKHITTDEGLMSDTILRIKKDRTREIFWVVTSNSISYLDENYSVTTIKDFPYSNNFDIYQNENDEMWVLSSNGIYIVPTETMLKNAQILPFFYGRGNGLSCFATPNSYSELTADGDLYISGSAGVVLVNIDKENKLDNDVRILVPYIEADDKRIYPDETGSFTVSAGTKKISVCAYCYNYSLVDPEISYRLEGFDRTMKTVRRSELKPVDYTNLSGGEYFFKMQLLNVYGQVQDEISVRIVKKESLHEATWFRAFIILGFVGVVIILAYLASYHRMKKLKAKEQEQTLLIREIVEAFAKVIDMKDRYTNGHSMRVAEYTEMLARELGCDDETVEKYRNIALLHDIGKVGISSETLNKPGRLTDDEFKEIKSHSGKGYNVLKDISIMPELAIGARDHHERPDGHGYPRGISGEEIPRVAQIIAVADTFDAMYSDRPYRKRMNFEKAISIIKEVSGTQLTEDVVEAFLRLVERGEFKAEDDNGGGTTEDITNIHKKQEAEKKEDEKKEGESADSKDKEKDGE